MTDLSEDGVAALTELRPGHFKRVDGRIFLIFEGPAGGVDGDFDMIMDHLRRLP